MNQQRLTYRNIRYYARFYRLIALASLITVAVIVGSLVVGDSVRTTLERRVSDRLGDTETLLFARNGYLSEQLLQAEPFQTGSRGVLLSEGFVSYNGRLVPVTLWGVDRSDLPKGRALLNPVLTKELDLGPADELVLRLPAAGMVPSGSLFVSKNYTTSLRLTPGGTLSAAEGGNLNLRNEQVIPFNVFVNRQELAETLGVEGRINLLMSNRMLSESEVAKAWQPALSGLQAQRTNGEIQISSSRIFLQKEVVETLCAEDSTANRLFSYLANSLDRADCSIPYSFVTAVDQYDGQRLRKEEIWLSDYSAKRLNAHVGDTIHISYFHAKELKQLETDTLPLVVGRILPLSTWQADSTLSANFPGLANVERCTDWDSDLPIDMERITDEDEDYWNHYRATPKALIAYEAVAERWGNAYGVATQLRLQKADLSRLQPEQFGLQLIHPREAGLFAARNGVDFAGLFLALGFFIWVSALLLMLNPLKEMLYRRREEIALLRALGFSPKRMVALFWKEASPVVTVSALVGIGVGLLYTALVMWLLGNVWQGATQTDGFGVYPQASTLIGGTLGSLVLTLGLLRWSLSKALREPARAATSTAPSATRAKLLSLIWTIGTIGLTLLNALWWQSVPLFMLLGTGWIGMAACWGYAEVLHRRQEATQPLRQSTLVWATLHAQRKQALWAYLALAIGVFIVFAVGLNRKGFADNEQIQTGTGGFTLWGESRVPLYQELSTAEGRSKLALSDLPAGTLICQGLRYEADDASCLNLNRVTQPTAVGFPIEVLRESAFQIEQSLYPEERAATFDRLCRKEGEVYPALVDETVLTWGLMGQVGDTLYYPNDRGESVAIRLIGTLSNSILQGNLLMDRTLFSEIWPETSGSTLFLVKTPEAETKVAKQLIEQALHEYGIRVTTTNDRLRQFNEVTDTYLSIFMTLGGLGLLIGIFSFIIVIRKNLAMRREEIQLYRMLGFTDRWIETLLYRENRIVPLYALIAGSVGALVSVGVNFPHAGIALWLMAGGFLLLFIGCVLGFVKRYVRHEVNESKTNRI